MKKILFTLLAATVLFTARADEGMWLLPYLQKMNIKDMKQKGCRLSAEDIYSVENSSLKDAIVIFGRGCTGEIVSEKGLLLTNHHCGYGSIQALSSVEHDYLKNGFWAQSHAEEIPAPGLEVRFIRQIIDITADVIGSIPSIASEEEFTKLATENKKAVLSRLTEENPSMEVIAPSFFGNNRFFAFVMEVYKDVRLVGTPPTSIGKFGGETDNWMWPRHTGDFSVFRVYADKDNRPAEYSSENVPYKAETFLKVSTKGYEEGDFAMIMGFPGSTDRYMTSYEIDYTLQVDNPQRIFIRGERQAILKEDMLASDKIRIQYAAKYAQSSNYWKNSIGMSRGLKKLNVKAKKEAQEQSFQQWADKNTLPEEGYISALPKIKEYIELGWAARASLQYITEALVRAVEITSVAGEVARNIDNEERKERLVHYVENFYKDYNAPTDKKVAYRMFEITKQNCKSLPTIFAEVIDGKYSGDTRAYVEHLYDNTIFTDKAQVLALFDMTKEQRDEILAGDAAVHLAESVVAKISELRRAVGEISRLYSEGHRKYIAGLMLQSPDKMWASDANFTIRLTYGNILPYDPADGVKYNHYTTLKGVMEKENPENPTEFTVPERLKEIYATKDYGRYADRNGDMPVAFLANCDITGGNSGSPIMNSKGELIGLAFDGNWEAMSGDIAFEPDLQRTISVDIRYVMLVIDKFAGAGWLIDEMELR